ncbi:ABC-2 type transporter-domain-containing protein, partial [Blyttiomyces helicus]
MAIVDNFHFGKGGQKIKVFKPHKEKNKHNLELGGDPKPEKANGKEHAGRKAEAPSDATRTLTWSDVVYKVPHPTEKQSTLQLLDHISGYACPGTLTALMGSSGAGKTTLLDVLAGRKTIGTIEGSVAVGNIMHGPSFLKVSGYVEQIDVHNKDATVREALRFSAYLRQPKSVPTQEKNEYCEYVIGILELDDLGDALIGDPVSGVGLSMEERKRLTIGIELAARPKILFLDEPTSGLDSQASMNIVRLLENLAAEGQALVVTIHQPSATLFERFDRLLLLGRGGKMIYFGETGDNCQTLIDYFERNGADKCGAEENPAEYILDCIGAGTAATTNKTDWFAVWKASHECQNELKKGQRLRDESAAYVKAHQEEIAKIEETLQKDVLTFHQKTKLVMRRFFRSYWRSPEYNVGRINGTRLKLETQIICGLILGFTFYQVPNTPDGANNRVFALYMTSILGVVVVNLVQPMFVLEREYSVREVSSGTYSPLSFGISITTVELPFAIAASSAFFLIFYWTVGLNNQSDRIGYFYLLNVTFSLFCVSFGQLVASFTPNLLVASSIVPICTSILSLFCGVTISYTAMPTFYSSWLYWLDPYHYFIEGLIVNDLHGEPIVCDDRSLVAITPPDNTTCLAYMQPYL